MLSLANLDAVRALMLEELDMDVAAGSVYRSERLTDHGFVEYPALMREAIEGRNDEWLARQINERDFLKSHEQRRKPKGGYTMARVPVTAAQTLAEGEFNRYYIRAACRAALESGQQVEVYRAKQVEQPRWESQQLIGSLMDPQALLTDLRVNSSVDAALRVPNGPNSGLSVRLTN